MSYKEQDTIEDLREQFIELTGETPEDMGVDLEEWVDNGCSLCGATPMTANCNNAGCS